MLTTLGTVFLLVLRTGVLNSDMVRTKIEIKNYNKVEVCKLFMADRWKSLNSFESIKR